MVDCMIFLSHRFADRAIADVARKHLGMWGFDNKIFQASAPGQGAAAGASITDEIKDALHDTKLFMLIFTLPDYDWSYCMWECGLATHPRNLNTRSIVLQCNPHEAPKTFEGQLLIRADEEGIKNFTTQLHRDEGFFPGEPAYRSDIADTTLNDLSTSFYTELERVIPKGRHEERHRWDFFTLQMTQAQIRDLMAKGDPDAALQTLPEECLVTQSFGEAMKHFGYANIEPRMTLHSLIQRWRERTRDRERASDLWVNELCSEIYAAMENSPASPEWKDLNSLVYPGSWFYPVLNHVRVMPDGSMELQVYLYRSLGG